MAVSLNTVFGFNSKLQTRCQHVSRFSSGAAESRTNFITFPMGILGSGRQIMRRKSGLCLSIVDSDQLAADSGNKGSGDADRQVSGNQVSAANSSLDTTGQNGVSQESVNEASNGSTVSSSLKQEASSTTKKSPLTARERLRAARVLNRYAESKPSKNEMGSKVLDALRESDKGKKRSGLPEAPINLFDDSKRGLPKPGLTFQFPGGSDLFLIIFSFVFISTVMFTTTFIVWKVGAIHFNEY
ncbi:hypothetical protein SLA2020_504440 [Shorea laevis]